MKKTLAALLLVTALLASVVPALAASTSAPKGSPAYKHYVACGTSEKSKPAHVCPKGSQKAAFFKSLKADVIYKVCVRFPTRKTICTKKPEKAKQGTLYFNRITSNIPGRHRVAWFVEGKRVGVYFFRVAG